MIKFSVTIPAYKIVFLAEAIESVLCQSYKNFELIIVDDCSPDDLKSVVDRYSDGRIRYYRNEKNCGAIHVVDNWNKCLEYATGDYVICMGDDDRLLPCCLEEYIKLMEKYPDLGVYHAWTEIIDENGDFLQLQHPRPEYEGALSLIWNRWNGRSLQFIGDFCYERRTLVNKGGFFSLPMAWASDDISAIIAADNKGIANTQRLCFQYRENRGTITRSGDWKVKMEATINEEKWIIDYLKKKKVEELSTIESKYLEMLIEERERYFKNKYLFNLIMGFSSKSISLCNSFSLRNQIRLSKTDIIRYWMRSKLK